MINNRQAGRRRGRGGNNGGGGNGGNPRQGGNAGRDGGNRIDNRARGNAAQLLEKYKNLARDAQLSGDRVNIEYYLQFADHYFRVLSEQRSRFEESQPRRQQSDSFDDGYDGEGEDEFGQEGEPIRAGEQGAPMRTSEQSAPMRDGNRNDGQRYGQRGSGDGQSRDDGQRGEGQRNAGQRAEGEQEQRGADRATRPYAEGERRPRRERIEAQEATPREAEPVAESVTPVNDTAAVEAETPRRRGRPRREVAQVEETATFEADRLPPSLGISAVANDVDASGADAPKPRRRRVPRSEASAAE